MIYIYGRTRAPRKTTDIYLPLTREDRPLFSGERQPMSLAFFDATKNHRCADRYERSILSPIGHRKGVKGRTLRNHREG